MTRGERSQLSDSQREQLARVMPSIDRRLRYHPCSVRLSNGKTYSRVLLSEYSTWYEEWGIDPEDDPDKRSIDVKRVEDIWESPHRLPAHIATKIYTQPESGMGYYRFKLTLDDGRSVDCLTGNVVDFLKWPHDLSPRKVVDVAVYGGPSRSNPDLRVARYVWCLYSD